ncbi:MAG: hypothetical protein II685_06975, partial [Clostridia bacterium]|nr:hypothetical protein [Clostridia bacterium]
ASRDNSFFRRELVRMKEGFSFAVLAEAENGTFPAEEIVYMGQKRSAFRVTTVDAAPVFGVHAESNPSKIIADAIARAFANCDGSWYYALSDIILEKCAQYSAFSIVEEKHLRILTTDYKAKNIIHKLKRSRERLSSIRAGSVFYAEQPDLALKKSAETAGYNQIVKLGGK